MTQASVNTPINTGALNVLSLVCSFHFPTGSKHSRNDELCLLKDDSVCKSEVTQSYEAKSVLCRPALYAFCDCE